MPHRTHWGTEHLPALSKRSSTRLRQCHVVTTGLSSYRAHFFRIGVTQRRTDVIDRGIEETHRCTDAMHRCPGATHANIDDPDACTARTHGCTAVTVPRTAHTS